MSRIINLEIKNCGDCIFSFYELKEKEGFYCRKTQTPFFLGTNSVEDTKILSNEIHKHCPLPTNKLYEDKCKKCQSISVEREYGLGGFYCHDCQEYTG